MDMTKIGVAIGSASVALAATLGTTAFAQSAPAGTPDDAIDRTACAAAIDAHEDTIWAARDALYAKEKAASQTRVDAMKAALAIDDDDARKEAMKAAMEDFREAMESAHEEFRTATESAHEAIKESCGRAGAMLLGGKGHGPKDGFAKGIMKMKMHRGEKPGANQQ